jgi:hypothetical protein
MNRKDFVHRSISLDDDGEISVSITKTTLESTHSVAIYRKNRPQGGEENPDKWTQVLRMDRKAAKDLIHLLSSVLRESCSLELRDERNIIGKETVQT